MNWIFFTVSHAVDIPSIFKSVLWQTCTARLTICLLQIRQIKHLGPVDYCWERNGQNAWNTQTDITSPKINFVIVHEIYTYSCLFRITAWSQWCVGRTRRSQECRMYMGLLQNALQVLSGMLLRSDDPALWTVSRRLLGRVLRHPGIPTRVVLHT